MQHFQIKPQRGAKPQALGQAGGVDVHDHVDEGLDLGSSTGGPDVHARDAETFQDWLDSLVDVLAAAAHQVQRAVPRLRDAAGHATFQAVRAGGFGQRLNVHVNLRRDGGAVDEGRAGGVSQQAVAAFTEHVMHRRVIGNHRDYDVGGRRYGRQRVRGQAVELTRQRFSDVALHVVYGGDREALIVEVARHVGAHASDADEPDPLCRSRHQSFPLKRCGARRALVGRPRPVIPLCPGVSRSLPRESRSNPQAR